MFKEIRWSELKDAFLETFLMSFTTGLFVLVLGLLLGYLLYLTEEKKHFTYKILNIISSIFRSIPFIILLVLIIPFTKSLFDFIFGSNQKLLFNWQGAVPALVISATPFYAKLVQNSLKEIPQPTKEMLYSLGANNLTIFRLLFSEAMPSLVAGFTTTIVTLIGFTSAAAIIGAGGLGDLAARERNHFNIVLVSTALILLLVFVAQSIGDLIFKKINKK